MPINAQLIDKINNIISMPHAIIPDELWDAMADEMVDNNDIKTIESIIKKIASSDEIEANQNVTLLQLSCKYTTAKVAQKILASEPNKAKVINEFNGFNTNAFILAILKQDLSIIADFLQNGADLDLMLEDSQSKEKISILQFVDGYLDDNRKVLELLVLHGADKKNKWDQPTIDFFNSISHLEIFDFSQAPLLYQYFILSDQAIQTNRDRAFKWFPALYSELNVTDEGISLPIELQHAIDKNIDIKEAVEKHYHKKYQCYLSWKTLQQLPPPYSKGIDIPFTIQLLESQAIKREHLPSVKNLRSNITDKTLIAESIAFCYDINACASLAYSLSEQSSSDQYEKLTNLFVHHTALSNLKWSVIKVNLQKSLKSALDNPKNTEGNHLEKYGEKIKKAILVYAYNLILPILAKKYSIAYQFDNVRVSMLIEDHVKKMLPEIVELLFNKLSLTQINKFYDEWSGPGNQAKLRKTKEAPTDAIWEPVVAKKIIEVPKSITGELGWHIVNLTSDESLKDEAHRMNSCIGSYTTVGFCKKNHFFSVRNPADQSEWSLMYVIKSSMSGSPKLVFSQGRGYEGVEAKPPSEKTQKVIDWLNQQIEKGEIAGIKINYSYLEEKRLERVKKAHGFLGIIKNIIHFNPLDEEKYQEVKSCLKNMLPKNMLQNYEALNQKLDNLCDKLIKSLPEELYIKTQILIQLNNIIDSKHWSKPPMALQKIKQVINSDLPINDIFDAIKAAITTNNSGLGSMFYNIKEIFVKDRVANQLYQIINSAKFDRDTLDNLCKLHHEVASYRLQP